MSPRLRAVVGFKRGPIKKGSDPEIESKCSLELNGVLDEPVRDVVDIEVLLYPEDEIRVGTARPVLPVCPCLPARPRRRLPPLPSVEPPPPLIRGFRTEPGKNDLHYCQRGLPRARPLF